ncbi:MAG: hypothetical protein CL943_01110 [Candidatus Diapherotrites archaeon]|uniref:Zona occludens toxin N-terminal domain-containing protein n=1 Tax=Candidatus Iainarchaeum sp. TaxID=3101447 RepID=A0A2D6M0D5_9ARCH|nr:hypothetical protein [Candidatus Diapherotrites archaeon]|tara:strand:+ start:3963 stop:4832 length:870 start_codon:yes stop_codon:yes gene_type:complete
MTEPIPPYIKRNFILRKVWTDPRRKNKGISLLFVGRLGSGKSYAGLRFCEDLDKDFSIERVCFSVEEFLRLIKDGNLRPGSCILFDEVSGSEEGADSRSAMTKINKIMAYVVSTVRFKRFVIIYTSPTTGRIDSIIRRVGIDGVAIFKKVDFKRKRSVADFRWSMLAPLDTSKLYLSHPRVQMPNKEIVEIERILISLPSKKLAEAYEKKKNKFFDENVKRWYAEFSETKRKSASRNKISIKSIYKRAIKRIDSLLDDKGKPSIAKIRLKYNLTQRNAQQIKALLSEKK